MYSSAPKFGKIILLLKNGMDIPSETKEYLNSAMIITGDYVIISEETEDEDWTSPSEIKGTIYEMKKIHSYKLLKK
jgi:hypothetical protein